MCFFPLALKMLNLRWLRDCLEPFEPRVSERLRRDCFRFKRVAARER